MSNELSIYNGAEDFADMRQSDILTPRIKLMQFTSQEVKTRKRNAGEFVSQVDNGVLIPADKSSLVVPLMFWLQWIEWNPDRAAPKDKLILDQSTDPRGALAKRAESFEKIQTKNGPKLAVTENYNFLLALPEISGNYTDIYIYSFARSSHKIGKTWLNRMQRIRHGGNIAPIWMHAWPLSSKVEKKENDEYCVPVIGDAQQIPQDSWDQLNELSKQLKSRKAEMAARAAASETSEHAEGEGNQAKTGEQPPF
jgi:hypothetical protein